ncbi:formyltetrahydrofolate deformylase [Tanticharoenia sakaeratensis]|uniref:Formyltetrahydrofolate deformylase n=1 Tax=Tanticharoenia sakaeratensis NBRC 103193 TaxID=1231623 RepID=A0A0D6MHC1_9PROT|nr:formyltetrahydrofolate deformylase [Tanticharoenia sakaeratensis]GAN52896.1 formyltetrahydrofolate deformylase [Tanticharoenia sakaeratensis NBRC 103193]GBQ18250.1 formyltetrahydrofolate deformylase [Tanticharoenia sakaeratensis NBRC 103193]
MTHTLTLTCAGRPGIVAAYSGALFAHGQTIDEFDQHEDPGTGRLFMRVAFHAVGGDAAMTAGSLSTALRELGVQFGARWSLNDGRTKRRVVLMVSKFDHCLADLLYRWRLGELPMTPVAIVSNHPCSPTIAGLLGDIPYHHLPVTRDTRAAQEDRLRALLSMLACDLVVLARYMQVLSDQLAHELTGRCINIHHSFLPSFKGARPYHQAQARGVKLIGATAHYVTGDLDEGPIIEQDVERISHADSPDDLIRKGRDVERRVLSRAVRYHLTDRVLLDGVRTVVFPD